MRRYPNWLAAYERYTSATEAPADFHFWTGVATIAGALRRCVWIDEKVFLWLPNFYIVLVGPPGVATKSTTLDLGMRLLEAVPDVSFGPPSATWQALTQAIAEAKMTVQWTDSDGVIHDRAACPVTIAAPELGTFLKIGAEGFIDVLTDLWDGKHSTRAWTHRTKTSGLTTIEHPWINLIGCTTPSWIQENVRQDMIGGGFFSRVLFVYGSVKRDFIPYPSQVQRAADFDSLQEGLVADLTDISLMRGEFALTAEAREWGNEWYFRHWASIASHMVSSRYEGYRARKQTHMHKLAMILSAAESSDRVIHTHHLQEAERFLGSAEHSMNLVYESVGVVDEAKRIREICALLTNYAPAYPDGLPASELFKILQKNMTQKEFKEAVSAGVEARAFTNIPLHVNGKQVWALRLP